MNPLFKSLLWLAAGAATVLVGMRYQMQREIGTLQQEEALVTSRATELVRETAMMRAKLEQAQIDSSAAAEFETKYHASVATIAAEQKKIVELLAKWPSVEAERAAAVQAVRKHETTKPPSTLTLADGTRLDQFVLRSVPDEKTVSVEHASGLVKLTADKLPEEYKTRLGLGWKPEPPPALTIDKDGNAVIRQGIRKADEKAAAEETAEELGLGKADTTSMEGLTKAIVVVEAQLAKTQTAFEAERANIRKLGIFKPDVTSPGGKTYGALKKDANARLASLAGRLQSLRAERNNLQYKLKSF